MCALQERGARADGVPPTVVVLLRMCEVSADNYITIRQGENTCTLYEGSMSMLDEGQLPTYIVSQHDHLDLAYAAAMRYLRDEVVEYGLIPWPEDKP